MPTKISAAAPCLTQPELEKNFSPIVTSVWGRQQRSSTWTRRATRRCTCFISETEVSSLFRASFTTCCIKATDQQQLLFDATFILFDPIQGSTSHQHKHNAPNIENSSESQPQLTWTGLTKNTSNQAKPPYRNKHKTTPTVGQSKTSCYLRLWLERWSSPYWECQQWWHNSSSPSSPLVAL